MVDVCKQQEKNKANKNIFYPNFDEVLGKKIYKMNILKCIPTLFKMRFQF